MEVMKSYQMVVAEKWRCVGGGPCPIYRILYLYIGSLEWS
jgi:hypothetical protein